MKALEITSPRQSRIVEVAKPACGAGELLLRIRAVGLCGSDLSTFGGKNPLVSYPRVPGHEIAATIEERGADVPAYLERGENVTVVPYTSCGACASCLRGRPNACRRNETLGVQRDGAMTEYLAVPWQKVIPARGLGLEELALVEPLTVGFHAVDRAAVTDSDCVLVIGCGMIGLGAIVRASVRGSRVVAADIDDEKLAIAKAFGATFAVNTRTAALHARLEEITGGHGPDVVLEAVGSPATYRAAVEEVAFTGRVSCIGYAADDAPLPTRLFVQKELDIRGSRNATAADFVAVSAFLARRTLPLERVISRRVPLAEAGAALADWYADPPRSTKIIATVA